MRGSQKTRFSSPYPPTLSPKYDSPFSLSALYLVCGIAHMCDRPRPACACPGRGACMLIDVDRTLIVDRLISGTYSSNIPLKIPSAQLAPLHSFSTGRIVPTFLHCLAAIRPSHSHTVTGPFIPAPVPSSPASTDDRVSSILHRLSTQRRIGRHPDSTDVPSHLPKVQRPRLDARHLASLCRFTAYFYRTDEPAPSGVHNERADAPSGRRKRHLERRVSSGLPRGGAGAKLCRQRSRILQLQQGTLATLPPAPVSGFGLWSSTHQRALRQMRTPHARSHGI
ncbi:hypothetical protein BC826DRAFT_626188 [Russula brevipes]|nr:hypothetical protein BC826DRAFT_626188 [Russula brevipes]